ncbi:MAG: transposase [Myxococcota bacterium]
MAAAARPRRSHPRRCDRCSRSTTAPRRAAARCCSATRSRRGKLVASVDGLNLYASGVMADRAHLERTARYVLRPPFCARTVCPAARRAHHLRMKKPDRRGNTVLVLDAMALMARLAALIPAPRRQTHRLFGVLGPASTLRRHIVPVPTHRQGRAEGHSHDEQPPDYKQRIPWAELLRRTFDVDALECPRWREDCGW